MSFSKSILALARISKKSAGFSNFVRCRDMSKTALVFLAPGAEEMEAVIAIDVLRRGGVDVTVGGLPDGNVVKCSRDVRILPDIKISEAVSKKFDVLVLPGGLAGSQALSKSKEVGELLKNQEKDNKLIAAICAAPTALKEHGIGLGKSVTSYPSVKDQLVSGGENYSYKNEKVVVDGQLITSQGPGTAFEFALTIVEKLQGKEKATEVAKAMLLNF